MTRAPVRDSVGTFAVLTGDIIGSSRLSATELERTRSLVLEGARQFHSKSRPMVSGVPEFFRGDAWQLLLREPGRALRVALYLRALLRAKTGVSTRVSIGIGPVDAINRSRTSLSTGEAFTLSGHALDEITGYFDVTGALPDRAAVLVDWFPAMLHICSGLIRDWTRRQAQIISLALLPNSRTHERIGKSLRPPVSKQTVSESLAGANWRSLLEAIRVFETTDWPAVVGRPQPASLE